jgi:hypothetical protein
MNQTVMESLQCSELCAEMIKQKNAETSGNTNFQHSALDRHAKANPEHVLLVVPG